ncbi:hypothetical protein C8R44DRAFT_911088, partial [Mycena epipterygia]
MSELIFVTGASGFLGPHVVLQLLEKGYHVRAVARGTKADFLKSSYSSYGDHFEVVRIADIAHDQFPEALVGVDAVVHLASPLAGRAEPVALLASAVEGTPNVLVQAEKAGVKRMVVTSSIATSRLRPEQHPPVDWIPVTREIALTSTNEMITYAASKKFSEIALWEWADRRPHVEPRVLNPPFFYGPFTSHFPIPSPNFNTLSTNAIFYNYLFPDGAFGSSTPYIGIRDVAQVRIRALNSPPWHRRGRAKTYHHRIPARMAVPEDSGFHRTRTPHAQEPAHHRYFQARTL